MPRGARFVAVFQIAVQRALTRIEVDRPTRAPR
jgi:hypothetical protein